jgi:hypothetical protein
MHELERRTAELLAQGLGTEAIARELDVSPRTIQRYKKLPDVQRLVASRVRAEDPTSDAVLRDALNACKRDGAPDHAIRLQELKLLIQTGSKPTPEAAEQTVVNIWKRDAA